MSRNQRRFYIANPLMIINKLKLKFTAIRDNNGGELEPEKQQVEMELHRQLYNGVQRYGQTIRASSSN